MNGIRKFAPKSQKYNTFWHGLHGAISIEKFSKNKFSRQFSLSMVPYI